MRLVEGLPLPMGEQPMTSNSTTLDTSWPPPGVRTRVLGEALVESDGSFYVNVVGDTPFYMETLDAEGKTVQTMRAWTWVRTVDQRGACAVDVPVGLSSFAGHGFPPPGLRHLPAYFPCLFQGLFTPFGIHSIGY